MQIPLSITEIQKLLPQTYPFLLIDRVIAFDQQQGTITCVKNITINESFFRGHFPGNPVMPGVLMIEALAQASILLYAGLKPDIAQSHPQYFLGKVDLKFKRVVRPGDQLLLEITKEKILDRGGVVSAIAKVGNETAVSGTISFGVKP